MKNKLLGDWRLRISNSNNANFSVATRLHFFDANTMSDKEVFADINSAVSLGACVDLDSEGFVPVSGVWLSTGAYSCTVETYSYTDSFNVDIYESVWTIPYIAGADSASDGSSVTIFDTVSDMRAFDPDGTNAMCLGYYDVGDMLAGGASYYWSADSLASDDEGSVIKPTSYSDADAGRWIRIFEELPTIRDFGAIPGQANVKVRILNTLTYSSNNNLLTIFPAGDYELVAEDLTLSETCVIRDNCFFNGSGSVTFDGCVIESNHKLSNNSLFNNIPLLRPEWFGAIGDGIANDSYELSQTVNKAITFGVGVELTDKYLLNDVWPIESTDIPIVVREGASIVIGINQTGVIDIEGVVPSSGGFISGYLEYVKVFDGMRSSYFDSLTDSDLIDLFNGTDLVSFIFDTTIAITTVHSEYSYIRFIYDIGFKMLIGVNGSFTLNNDNMYFDMFDSVDTISRVKGSFSLTTRYNNDTYSLSSNIAFNADVTIKDCELYITGTTDIAFSNLYYNIYLDNIKLSGLLAGTTLYLDAGNLSLKKITSTGINLGLLSHSETLGYYLRARLDDVTLSNAVINAVSIGANAVCDLDIQHCTFAYPIGVTSEVVGTGATWVNDSTSHNVIIKNNTCSSGQCITTELKQTKKELISDTYIGYWLSANMTTAQFTGDTIDASAFVFVLYGNTLAPVKIETHSAMAELWTDTLTAWVANQPVCLYSSKGYEAVTQDSSTIVYSDLSGGLIGLWRTPMQAVSGFAEVYLHHTYTISTYK